MQLAPGLGTRDSVLHTPTGAGLSTRKDRDRKRKPSPALGASCFVHKLQLSSSGLLPVIANSNSSPGRPCIEVERPQENLIGTCSIVCSPPASSYATKPHQLSDLSRAWDQPLQTNQTLLLRGLTTEYLQSLSGNHYEHPIPLRLGPGLTRELDLEEARWDWLSRSAIDDTYILCHPTLQLLSPLIV